MGDAVGQVTHSLLGTTTYLKDNRLPPRGFGLDRPEHLHTAIRGGATDDANFNSGGRGRDEVAYRVVIDPAGGSLVAEVELLYQSVPREAVMHLLQAQGTAAVEFKGLYSATDKTPETVQRLRVTL